MDQNVYLDYITFCSVLMFSKGYSWTRARIDSTNRSAASRRLAAGAGVPDGGLGGGFAWAGWRGPVPVVPVGCGDEARPLLHGKLRRFLSVL